jgi:hypothetical protein
VLLNLDVEFRDSLAASEIEVAIDRIEKAIQDKHPEVTHIFLEAESIAEALASAQPKRAT